MTPFASTCISLDAQAQSASKKKSSRRQGEPAPGLVAMLLDGLCACSATSSAVTEDEKVQRYTSSFDQYATEPSSFSHSTSGSRRSTAAYRLHRVNSNGTLSTVPMSDRSFLDDEYDSEDEECNDDENSILTSYYHTTTKESHGLEDQRDDREVERHVIPSLRRPTSFDGFVEYESALDSHIDHSISGSQFHHDFATSCFYPYSTFASELPLFESRAQNQHSPNNNTRSASLLPSRDDMSSDEQRRLILARHFSRQLL